MEVVDLSARPARRGRRARLALALGLVLAVGALAGPAAGAHPLRLHGTYSAALIPATAPAGATLTTTLRVVNNSNRLLPALGSVKVTVPAALTVTSIATPATVRADGRPSWKRWSATPVAGGVLLRANRLIDVLLAGESVTIGVTAVAPCGAGTVTLATEASSARLAWTSGGLTPFSGSWSLSGAAPALTVTGACAPNELAITSVNGGGDPVVDEPFDVVVELRSSGGDPVTAPSDTPVTLTVAQGSGQLSTVSGTIPAGSSSTTISTSYDVVENEVGIVAGGTGVGASDPAVFDALSVLVTGPATPANPLRTCAETTPENPVCASVFVEGPETAARTYSLSEQSCVFGETSVCIASLVEFLGDFASAVATIQIEYDSTLELDPSEMELFYELTEGAGFVEAPDCYGGEVYRAPQGGSSPPVVFPKPMCVSDRFVDGEGDSVIEALFDEDPRLGTR